MRLGLKVEGPAISVPTTTTTTSLPDGDSDGRKAAPRSSLRFGLEDDNGARCVSSSVSSLSSSSWSLSA